MEQGSEARLRLGIKVNKLISWCLDSAGGAIERRGIEVFVVIAAGRVHRLTNRILKRKEDTGPMCE